MSGDVVTELKDIVESHHLLNHPFYQAWTAGQLPVERLQRYAVRYYPHIAHFPRYISAIHARCADLATRQVLLENLTEEEGGEDNHPELWLRFAEALGVPRDEVRGAAPVPAADSLVRTYGELAATGPLAQGLAALYVYESQIPPIAAAKIDGLTRWYGVEDERGLAFFRVHEQADVWHAEATADLLDKHTTRPSDADAARAGGQRAVTALWEMLDGV
jgi:pyrroloquinoline-quinone synthase